MIPSLTTAKALADLLDELRNHDLRSEIAAVLATGPATRITEINARDLTRLITHARDLGKSGQVAAFVDRATSVQIAQHADGLLDTSALTNLLTTLIEAGHAPQAAVLAKRMAIESDIADPDVVAILLDAFEEAGFPEQWRHLLERDPIAFPVGFDRFNLKYGAAHLLRTLTNLREAELAQRFAERVVADAEPVGKMARNTARVLIEIGKPDLAAELLRKAADNGYYWTFTEADPDSARRFPHGRELSGQASPRCSWKDLEQ